MDMSPWKRTLVRGGEANLAAITRPVFPDIHLWRIPLDQSEQVKQQLFLSLAPDEQERVQKIRYDQRRREYLVCRGAARDILSQYLNAAPSEIQFYREDLGKPRIKQDAFVTPDAPGPSDAPTADAAVLPPLDFNLSHSREYALLAASSGCNLGVDLQYYSKNESLLRLANRFYSPDECAVLRSLPESLRFRAFIRGWAQKEAYLKALGGRIFARGLKEFTVEMDPDKAPALLKDDVYADAPERWRFQNIDLGPDYGAVLIVDRTNAPCMHNFEWVAPSESP